MSYQRDSNLELYRIIIMLHIVAHHYVVNSGLMDLMYENPLSDKSIFLFLFGMWGKTGINCFVLITGYFMCTSTISLRKFLKLGLEVLFYNIVIYSVFLLSGYEAFSIVGCLKSLLPITSVSNGFISCYILFYLFIPFLNTLIRNMTEKQHLFLIGLLLFVYTVLAKIPKIEVTMNYITWFIVLYFVASWIRLYPRKIFLSKKFIRGGVFLSILISYISVLILLAIGEKIKKEVAYYFVSDSNAIMALIVSVCVFLFFKDMKIRYNKYINIIGASTFGILCIHGNSYTMIRWLWVDTLNNTGIFSSDLVHIMVHAVLSVIVVFFICSFFDILRTRYIENPLFKVLTPHIEKWQTWLSNKIA